MSILFIDVRGPDERTIPCTKGSPYPHTPFWAIRRQPAGQMGHFMVFRINGEEHVIDASVPTGLDKLPRDAVEITGELFEAILHDTSGSHCWGEGHLEEVNILIQRELRGRQVKTRRMIAG